MPLFCSLKLKIANRTYLERLDIWKSRQSAHIKSDQSSCTFPIYNLIQEICLDIEFHCKTIPNSPRTSSSSYSVHLGHTDWECHRYDHFHTSECSKWTIFRSLFEFQHRPQMAFSWTLTQYWCSMTPRLCNMVQGATSQYQFQQQLHLPFLAVGKFTNAFIMPKSGWMIFDTFECNAYRYIRYFKHSYNLQFNASEPKNIYI